jgi:GNAT superfamily N-acetyltransferase
MSVAAWLARRFARALAPWGEFGWDVLLERSLQDDLPAVKPDADVTLRLALPADIDEISRLYSSDPWLYLGEGPPTPASREKARELYLDRLRRGELCFLAMSGDAIAHVNWICFAWGDALPEHPIRLRDGEVFTTDAITPPAFRGKGLHAYVLRAMLAHARARGYRRAYALTQVDRTSATRAHLQLGWRECGYVIHFLPRGRSKAWFLWRRGNVEPLFRPA